MNETSYTIPDREAFLTDSQLFEAIDLSMPQLSGVKEALSAGDVFSAKKALISYFEHRQNVSFFYDFRSLPLKRMEPDELPYAYQSSLGLRGSLKKFCLKSAVSMLTHRYILPGGRQEVDLGSDFETMIHFNFLEDQGKRHRHSLDMFVRGQFLEALCVLYHESGDKKVLNSFTEILHKFWETYPLTVADTSPDANRFQYTEDRDVMSVGWLAIVYMGLFYTRAPYETDTETAFEILKRLWFLGIQFKRFEADSYRPYNHHMWERGLVPFLLSILLPEITEFRSYRERGANVVCRHIKEDFNEDGGYSEHSIAYWSGAAIGEMLFRGIFLAKLNRQTLLDEEAAHKMEATFSLLCMLTPPGRLLPSLGDNGGPLADPILSLGDKMLAHPMCRELIAARADGRDSDPSLLPLDFCSSKAGFLCSRNSYRQDGNYILMSVKTECGCSGHNHMDMLSLFLTFRGQEFIGEPYADKLYHSVRMGSPERGYMYNMASHNTVLAHGKPVLPDRVYSEKWGVYRPDSPVTAFLTSPDGIYASARHDAYTFCRHTRKILFHRTRGLILRDEIERGFRLPEPHIQRWHLEFGVSCTVLDGSSVLLKKNGVSLLCLWSGCGNIRLWKNRLILPEIYPSEDDLSPILDISFGGKTEDSIQNAENGTAALNLLILDVTDTLYDFTAPLSLKALEFIGELKESLDDIAADLEDRSSLERFPSPACHTLRK